MSVIHDILHKLDFIDLVNKRTVVTRLKESEYRGLSPFTNEKTPSFYVNNNSKTWYDFSSGQGGGVLDYVMKVEELDKDGALAFLANLVGIKRDHDNTTIRDIVLDANKYFRSNSDKARKYFAKRGFTPKLVSKYKLGYAPDTNELIKLLRSKGYQDEDIIKSGLAYKKNRGIDVLFRNRVIFPIKDVYGNLVSFTGRDTTDTAKAKYLHGRTSPIFSIKSLIWNLSDVRKLAMELNQIILCEGQMDALAITEAGFPGVAILGSSPTEQQLALLAKTVQNIYVNFDSDEAGQRGMRKVFSLLVETKLDVLVYAIILPPKTDPDEFIHKNGAEAFKKLVEDAQPDTSVMVKFEFDKALKNPRSTTAGRNNRVVKQMLPYIKQSFTYRTLDLIERMSQELGLNKKELHDWISQQDKEKPLSQIKVTDFQAPIYERRILHGLLDNPVLMGKFKSAGLVETDFESFFISKVVSFIPSSLDSADLFEVLKDKLSEDDYYDVLSFYSQGLQDVDFDSALNVMKSKVYNRQRSMTDFLGRPLSKKERHLRPTIADKIKRDAE